MRRKDREMPESFAFQVADNCPFATLSLIDPEGFPYAVPLQILCDEKNIYFHSATKGFKLDCLKANPNVCISAVANFHVVSEEFTTKYQSATLRGTATELTDPTEKSRFLQKLAEKYTPHHAHLAHKEISAYLSATALWKIEISSATGKEHK